MGGAYTHPTQYYEYLFTHGAVSTERGVLVSQAGPSLSPLPRDASQGKGPQRRPQKRLGRRLEGVAEAVGGGYCRL